MSPPTISTTTAHSTSSNPPPRASIHVENAGAQTSRDPRRPSWIWRRLAAYGGRPRHRVGPCVREEIGREKGEKGREQQKGRSAPGRRPLSLSLFPLSPPSSPVLPSLTYPPVFSASETGSHAVVAGYPFSSLSLFRERTRERKGDKRAQQRRSAQSFSLFSSLSFSTMRGEKREMNYYYYPKKRARRI